MHEWALAEAVIRTALALLEREKAKEILEVEVLIGELQQVDIDIFEMALNELKKETPMEKALITIKKEPARFKCRSCGTEWSLSEVEDELSEEEVESIHFIPELAHAFIKCPNCGSPDFDVVQGRGVWIGKIEVRK